MTIAASQTRAPATTDTNAYYNTKNRLRRVTRACQGEVRNLTCAASGDVENDTREDGTEFSYFYAETGRLERVYAQGWIDKTQSEVATYSHDYRGLRIPRVGAGGSVRHFIFLSDGRLLGEYDGSTGQAVMEYIWLGDRLVAQMDAGGTLSHVLTGHLGQPLRIMAGDGAVLWAGEMDPFGRYYDTVHGAPYTASPLHLRLPGQWAGEALCAIGSSPARTAPASTKTGTATMTPASAAICKPTQSDWRAGSRCMATPIRTRCALSIRRGLMVRGMITCHRAIIWAANRR